MKQYSMLLLLLVGCQQGTGLVVLGPNRAPVVGATVVPVQLSEAYKEQTSTTGAIRPTAWRPRDHRVLRVVAPTFGEQELTCTEVSECWGEGALELGAVTPISIMFVAGVDIAGEFELRRRVITYNSIAIYRTGIFRCPLKSGVYSGVCSTGGCQLIVRSHSEEAMLLGAQLTAPNQFQLSPIQGRPLTVRVVDDGGVPVAGVQCIIHGRDDLASDSNIAVRYEIIQATDERGEIRIATCGSIPRALGQ